MHGRGSGELYIKTGFILDREPDTVLGPDLAFVRADRVPKGDEEIWFLEQAPDIAVEVLYANDRASDVFAKINEYLRAGVEHLWIVDPERNSAAVFGANMQIRFLSQDEELEADDLIPELRIRLADIFKFPRF